MLKVYLKLLAKKDIDSVGYKAGNVIEMVNDIFDNQVGLVYYSLNKNWEILEMKIVEFKEIK